MLDVAACPVDLLSLILVCSVVRELGGPERGLPFRKAPPTLELMDTVPEAVV